MQTRPLEPSAATMAVRLGAPLGDHVAARDRRPGPDARPQVINPVGSDEAGRAARQTAGAMTALKFVGISSTLELF
jgi:hypothetical protein